MMLIVFLAHHLVFSLQFHGFSGLKPNYRIRDGLQQINILRVRVFQIAPN